MAPKAQVCLGVAVDHRIQRLFQTVTIELNEESTHVSDIRAYGQSLNRPGNEIEVTAQLAGPAYKGGIMVVLQQPRKTHLFDEGVNAVIEDFESLKAIRDVFSAVSLGSIDLVRDIAIVDLLPYEAEQRIGEINDMKLKEAFRTSVNVVCEKKPSVLLCAARIRTDKNDAQKRDIATLKGEARKLEKLNLGERFGASRKPPVTATIVSEKHRHVSITRVNGFHPSYAMNYCPHVSVLRQLQILIGAETCGMFRQDWKDKEWMDDLRMRSQDKSRSSSNSPYKFHPDWSPSQSRTASKNIKFLPDYQELYSDILVRLRDNVTVLFSDPELSKCSAASTYDAILSTNLSEICNDASLILRQMACLERRGWPKGYAEVNITALEQAAYESTCIVGGLYRSAKVGDEKQFTPIIRRGTRSIYDRIEQETGRQENLYFDLSGAADDFVKMAVDIETLLSKLLAMKETKALEDAEVLSNLLRELKMGSG